LKLIAKFASVVLIMILIKYFTAILATQAFILHAMGYNKYQNSRFIFVIAANSKRDTTTKKLYAKYAAKLAFL
jgi:hypothetical protein